MDYKYIEQLLEHYWNCETSAEEEQILRIFFQQKEIPLHLRTYQPLFSYQKKAEDVKLGEDFDQRILQEIERPVVKARHLTLYTRCCPSAASGTVPCVCSFVSPSRMLVLLCSAASCVMMTSPVAAST